MTIVTKNLIKDVFVSNTGDAIDGTLTVTGGIDQLTTAGSPVDISTAGNPVIGQALIATSTNTATWQDVGTASAFNDLTDVTAVATTGELIHYDGSGWSNTTGMFYDAANKKLGVGTKFPNVSAGQIQTTGDIDLEGGLRYRLADNSIPIIQYRNGDGFLTTRAYDDVYTLCQIWSPPGTIVTDNLEATLALVRGDEPNQEFMDVYNNGYGDETQFGIRMQKRGTGVYRNFVIDYHDGTNPKIPVFKIKPDISATFAGEVNGAITATAASHLTRKDYSDSYADSKVSINWETPALEGTELTLASGVPALAYLEDDIIAMIDTTLQELRTYAWSGTAWSQTGSGLSITGIADASLTALSSTTVAFVDGTLDSLRKYSWSGSAWTSVGSGFTIVGTNPAITALTSSTVAYIDSIYDVLSVYSFDGSVWSLVGNTLTLPGNGAPSLATLNSGTVAYVDNGIAELRTYEWDGTDWTQIGNGLAITGMGNPEIAAMNGSDIVFYDTTNDEIRMYRWDSADWTQIGTALSVAGSWAGVSKLNMTDMAFLDFTNKDLRAYRFGATYGDTLGKYTLDQNYVNVAGDTMTGQLKGITPVADEDLTRKDYVDDTAMLMSIVFG